MSNVFTRPGVIVEEVVLLEKPFTRQDPLRKIRALPGESRADAHFRTSVGVRAVAQNHSGNCPK